MPGLSLSRRLCAFVALTLLSASTTAISAVEVVVFVVGVIACLEESIREHDIVHFLRHALRATRGALRATPDALRATRKALSATRHALRFAT